MNTTAGNRQKRKGKGRRAGVIHLITRKLKFSVDFLHCGEKTAP